MQILNVEKSLKVIIKTKDFAVKNVVKKVYYQEHKEYWNPEPKRKIEAEQKKIKAENEAKREKRRNDINRLMAETGLKNKYGLVASFYDNNDLEGLYKYVDYLKSIGEIKEDINEPKIGQQRIIRLRINKMSKISRYDT